MKNQNISEEKLLYRRQFFFGPEKINLKSWKTFKMPDEKWLTCHPELNVVEVKKNGFQVILLGFILDPYQPKDSDQDILDALCEKSNNIEKLIRTTETLGGRWILFVYHNNEAVVFNDAGGTRTIFYHVDQQGHYWLATQPGLVNEKFHFEISEESKEYMRSDAFQRKTEIWWPGESSPFTEIQQMLPNHLINLKSKRVERYWPYQKAPKYSLQEGVKIAAEILRGVVESAHNRFPLVMSLSSGNDSRMVFSACKEFVKDIEVVSLLYRTLTEESDDIRIPAEMGAKLDFKHKIIDCRPEPDPEFLKIFNQNVVGLKTDWANIAEYRMKGISSEKVVLKGTISEIIRCRYWALGQYPWKVNLRTLVNAMGIGKTPLVVKSLNYWLKDASQTTKFGYKILDLLSWENEVGNWYAMGYAVFDIAQQDFTPFNNRKFFETMIGINPKYRSYPDHIAQREIVKYLWPELHSFPYTPNRRLPKKKFMDSPFINYLRSIKASLKKDDYGLEK